MVKKILDIRIPKEEQEEIKGRLKNALMDKGLKIKVTVKTHDNIIRYMYGKDEKTIRDTVSLMGYKIVKIEEIDF